MALDWTPSLDQTQSHSGFERYPLIPVNGGRDSLRIEYIRDFDVNLAPVTTAELDRRNALRATLLLCLNDEALLDNLAAVYNDPAVTDEDSFILAVATRLNA